MSLNRFLKARFGVAFLTGFLVLSTSAAQAAQSQWYFYVANKSDSRLVKLQVSEDRKNWGHFDIGSGIKSGQKVKLTWDASTDDESCDQWIRAKFADGTTSDPEQFNFCDDLDDPIEFE